MCCGPPTANMRWNDLELGEPDGGGALRAHRGSRHVPHRRRATLRGLCPPWNPRCRSAHRVSSSNPPSRTCRRSGIRSSGSLVADVHGDVDASDRGGVEGRCTTVDATSSGVAIRRSRIRLRSTILDSRCCLSSRPLVAASTYACSMAVAVAPGLTQLTRTVGASSAARCFVSARRPALAAAYAVCKLRARSAVTELTNTTPAPSIMQGTRPCVMKNGPARFTSTCRSKSARVVSQNGLGMWFPAECTIVATGRSPTAVTTRSTSGASPTSATTTSAPPPAVVMELATSSRVADVRPTRTTCSPRAASCSAADRPMPVPAPVTTASSVMWAAFRIGVSLLA